MADFEARNIESDWYSAHSFIKLTTRGGNAKIFEFTSKLIDYNGVQSTLFIGKDFTERLKTEEELSVSKERVLSDQINPAFIFDTLIAVKNHLKVLSASELVNYISDFSKLMRLYLSSLRKEFITLDDELRIISYYLDLQKLRYENNFTYELVMDQELANIAKLIEIPSLLIQPLVENGIENSIYCSGQKGKVRIYIDLKEDQVNVRVRDNGPIVMIDNMPSRDPVRSFMFSAYYEDRLHLLSKKHNADFNFNIEAIRTENSNQVEIMTSLSLPIL